MSVCDNSQFITPCNANADCGRGGRCVPFGKCGTGYCNFVGQLCAPENGGQPQLCREVGACVARDICDQAAYVAPAVEVMPLPGAAATIATSLMQHAPDDLPVSGTPTVVALNGALTHAKALQTANPLHKTVVVLATDGLPTSECEATLKSTATLVQNVISLAAGGAKANPTLPTFVIGVFAPDEAAMGQMNLDSVAAAGGTGKAFIVNTGQNVTMGFLAALDSIRTTSLPCEYNIPAPEAGQLDYRAVNVRLTDETGKVGTIPYSGGNAASCTNAGGWYYDADPMMGGSPKKIEVCPVSCTTIKAHPKGQVDILLGCKTEDIVR
jgi:hypothetical protein